MYHPTHSLLATPLRVLFWSGMLHALGASVTLAQSLAPPNEGDSRHITVATLQLRQDSGFSAKRQFSGQVEAHRKSRLGFERIGRILRIHFDRGDYVEAGQLLAELDIDSLQAQKQKLQAELSAAQAVFRELRAGPRVESIDSAKASLEEQKSQWLHAKEVYERREMLFRRKLIAEEEMTQARSALERARSGVQGMQRKVDELLAGTRPEQLEAQSANMDALLAGLKQLEVEIEKSKILAPYAGTMQTRELDEGSIAAPGQPIAVIIENRRLDARIGTIPSFTRSLVKDQSVELELNGQTITATVSGILSELDSNTRTQSLILRLAPDAYHLAVPGDTVRMAMAQAKTTNKGFWVPTEALVAGSRGLWNCFVVENLDNLGVGTVSQRVVEVLHTEGDRSLIAGEVREGEQLIRTAPHRVIAGQSVKLSEAKP